MEKLNLIPVELGSYFIFLYNCLPFFQLINYLLDESDFDCDVNFLEPSHGESPLTSAASHGRAGVCELLIRSYHASPHFRNRKGLVPLLCAIRHVSALLLTDASLCWWSSGNAIVYGAKGLIFKYCVGQIALIATNGSPPLQRFFQTSCVARRRNDGDKPRKLVTCFST